MDYLLDRLQHCDLVLVEGFKGGSFPKLEVWRAALGQPTLWPDWPGILAIASDTPSLPEPAAVAAPVVRLDLSQTRALGDFVLRHATGR